MLNPCATLFSIHPIYVFRIPIACHEYHTLVQLSQHEVEIVVTWAHAEDNLTIILADYCRECEIVAACIEPL